LQWADDIVVMELRHARQIRKQFAAHLKGKRIVNLDIPDRFTLMQPELVQRLEATASRWLAGVGGM